MNDRRRPSLRRNLGEIWNFWYTDVTLGWKERRGADKIPVFWLAPVTFLLATWNSICAIWTFVVFKFFHVAARKVVPVLTPQHAAPYGFDLANSVASVLEAEAAKSKSGYGAMAYHHRDYCGHGLFLEDGKFRVAEVEDGAGWETLLDFVNRDEFVCWLADQSDHSLSGYTGRGPFEDLRQGDNQRITRARLEQFVAERLS